MGREENEGGGFNASDAISQPNASSKVLKPSTAELEQRYMERMRIAGERKSAEKAAAQLSKQPSHCATPAQSDADPDTSIASDCDDGTWHGSLRSGRSLTGRSTAKLTKPKGPELRTADRPRSVSRGRSDAGAVIAAEASASWHANLRGSSRGPTSARKTSRSHSASASPARSAFSGRGRMMETPTGQNRRRNDSLSSVGSDIERSCDSRASRSSRLSQLSRRSQSRQHLSTAEMQQIIAEQGRQQIKSQIEQNRRTGRQAIVCPQLVAVRRSLSATLPKEFNLSCPGTPNRSVLSDSDAGDTPSWNQSLRRPSAPPSPGHAWQPALTISKGPYLRTSERSSRTPSRDGTPRKRSMSRHQNPREQDAIERHLDRLTAGQVLAETPSKHVSCRIVRSARSHEPLSGRSLSQALAREEVSASSGSVEAGEVLEPEKSFPADHGIDATGSSGARERTSESSAGLQPPAGANLEEWIAEAPSAEERAERKRIVVKMELRQQKPDQFLLDGAVKERKAGTLQRGGKSTSSRMIRKQPKRAGAAATDSAASATLQQQGDI